MITESSAHERIHDLPSQVLIALRLIIRAIDLHSRYLVNKFGLTGPQLNLLRELDSSGPTPVSKLAQAIHLSQATVTGIVCRLEAKGLVQRQRGSLDRRVVEVMLCDSAKELLARTPPLLQEHFSERFDALQDWEKHMIIASLQRIVGMMDIEKLDAMPILATGPVDTSTEDLKAFLNQPEQATLELSSELTPPPDHNKQTKRTDREKRKE